MENINRRKSPKIATVLKLNCNLCKYNCTKQSEYDRHLLTKKHINISNKPVILDNNSNSIQKFNCGCGNTYKSKQGLWKHKKTCNHINTEPDLSMNTDYNSVDKETLIQLLLKKEDDFQKKENDFQKKEEELLKQIELEKHRNTHNIESQNIESQTNNNLNIQINAFGCENLEYITDAFKIKCINQIYKSIPEMVIKIHFNTKYPENHNVKIPNKKLPHASIMTENNSWKTVDKKNTITSMVDKSFNLLDDTYEEHKGKLSETKRKNYEKYQEKYINNDKLLHKQLATDVECLVLDGTR
jgi:hypothetical protein